MSQGLVIFNVIKSSGEQQMLLQRLLSGNAVIHFTGVDGESVHLKVVSLNSNMQLRCKMPEGSRVTFPKVLTATFYLDFEKYLFESQPTIKDEHIMLPVFGLFHLQRRRNFRYTIPKGYSTELTFVKVAGKDCQVVSQVVDLSTEGCALNCPDSDAILGFSEGQTFEAHISFNRNKPIIVHGEIKNIRPSSGGTTLGLEFSHTRSGSEAAIEDSILVLQRDFFLKKSG